MEAGKTASAKHCEGRDMRLAGLLQLRRMARTHMSTGNIFVCYRHEDSWAYAGWLADALTRQFGKSRVFRDLDSQRGVDFRDQVDEAIDSCVVLLAVIGPRWLRVQDESGRRRIDHPSDLVALEIATALKRDIRVIPVLVGGVRMPREHDLPRAVGRTCVPHRDRAERYRLGPSDHRPRRRPVAGLRVDGR